MKSEIICSETLHCMRTSLPDACIDLIATSPPYNCRKDYGVASDEMDWRDYYNMMESIIQECYRVLVPGGTIAIVVPFAIRWQRDHKYKHTWSDWDTKYQTHRGSKIVYGKGRCEFTGLNLLEIMRQFDGHLREPIIWVKGSEGNAIASNNKMGCDSDPYLRSVHEWILLGSKDRWYHRGGTGRRGKKAVPYAEYTKDVWHVPPTSSKKHPAPFPIEIPTRLCRLFVHAKDAVVLDPFCGIGTTCITAAQLGHTYIGIDSNETYCQIARQNIQDAVGQLELEMGHDNVEEF